MGGANNRWAQRARADGQRRLERRFAEGKGKTGRAALRDKEAEKKSHASK